MTVYQKILYYIATKNLVPKSVLMILCNSPATVYRGISRGIERGYIIEKSIRVSSGNKHYKEDFLMITNSGLDFLCSLNLKELYWMNDIPFQKENPRVVDSNILGSVKVRRYLNVVASSIVAEEMGANVSPMFFDEGNSDYPLVRDVLKKAYSNNTMMIDGNVQKSNANDSQEHDDIDCKGKLGCAQNKNAASLLFCTSKEIKRIVTATGSDSIGLDVRRGKYTGLIECKNYVYTMYSTLKGKFEFSNDEAKQGRIAFDKYTHNRENCAKHRVRKAVLILPSSKEFKASFFDGSINARKDMIDCYIRSGIDEFCVFPISSDGISSLKAYIQGDIIEEEIKDAAVGSGQYTENNRKYSNELFPIVSNEEVPIMIGISMDILKLFSLESIANKHPNETFGVICYDWQVEYYDKIGLNLRIIKLST